MADECDKRTDRRTDGRTDRQTAPSLETAPSNDRRAKTFLQVWNFVHDMCAFCCTGFMCKSYSPTDDSPDCRVFITLKCLFWSRPGIGLLTTDSAAKWGERKGRGEKGNWDEREVRRREGKEREAGESVLPQIFLKLWPQYTLLHPYISSYPHIILLRILQPTLEPLWWGRQRLYCPRVWSW